MSEPNKDTEAVKCWCQGTGYEHKESHIPQPTPTEATCPKCGAKEVEALTPRTVYACGSSDYDQRPDTFIQVCSQPTPTIDSVVEDAKASLKEAGFVPATLNLKERAEYQLDFILRHVIREALSQNTAHHEATMREVMTEVIDLVSHNHIEHGWLKDKFEAIASRRGIPLIGKE